MDIIQIKNVSKEIKGNVILNNINMNIREGEIYGLLGPNGAGKTTLMKIMLQLSKPTSGSVKYWGKEMNKQSHDILQKIGNIIEYPAFYLNLTAIDNLKMHCQYMGIPEDGIKDMLDYVSLSNKANLKVCQFSLGMKQRLGLARAMLHNPKLLILDEPINGLDPMGIQEIRNMLMDLRDKQKVTILLSSHILSEVQLLADRVGIIREGVLLDEMELGGDSEGKRLEEYYIKVIGGEK